VQDTGIGIPANRQADIFKPFVQVKIPGAASREGSGLGLAISQQAVELMGGTLRVSSSVDGGSQFWFDLPMKKAERSVVPRQAPQRPTQASADHAEPPAPTAGAPRTTGVLRILLVDDNSTNLFLLKELLQQDGHVVVTASSGEVALGILSDHNDFDMLILDYNLGTMTGAEVLQIYRMGRSNPVPAWFLTADATRITAEKLNATGALGVLTKPVRIESLRSAVLAAAAQVRRDARSDTDRQGVTPAARTEAANAPPGRLRAVSVVYIDATAIGRLRAVGQTADFLVGMLSRAADDIAHATDRLGLAWHKGSLEDVRDAAHALKSVASETGAVRLANIAAAIMRADDDVLDSGRNRLLGDLRDTVDRTVAAMQEIIQRENKAASSF
jgi:two-component system sensor histidine kinase RpfC